MTKKLFNGHAGPAAVTPPMVEAIEKKLREEEADDQLEVDKPNQIKAEVVALASDKIIPKPERVSRAPKTVAPPVASKTSDSSQGNVNSGPTISNQRANGNGYYMNRKPSSSMSTGYRGTGRNSTRSNHYRSGNTSTRSTRNTKSFQSQSTRKKGSYTSSKGSRRQIFRRMRRN